MFIKIPVYWAEDEWEEKEDLGQAIDYYIGDLVINSDNIAAYHADKDGYTMIKLNNGETYRSPVSFEAFEKMYPDLKHAAEIYTTFKN